MEKLTRKLKTVNIHGKEYIEVKERILALVENNSPYSIETEYEYIDSRKMWIVKAKLTMIETGEVFTGLAQETEDDKTSMVNKTSALENAETSAVGRACAFAGIGVIDSIASADEVNKAINRESRTVDTPTGGTKIQWFNTKQLKECIAEGFGDTKESIKQWASDYGYTISKPMQEVIIKYLSSGEITEPNFGK